MRYNEMLYMWNMLHEEDLFARVQINEKIDMDILKRYIYSECYEMTTIVNNEISFEQLLVNTFAMWKDNIDRLVNVLSQEYDPLSDYYRKYEEDKNSGGEDSKSHIGEDNKNSSTVENMNKGTDYNGETKDFHSSYNMGDNESILTDREENLSVQNTKTDTNTVYDETGKNTYNQNGTFKENTKLNGKITGLYNHTFQELEDLEIAHASFNIYKWILENVVIRHLFLWLY